MLSASSPKANGPVEHTSVIYDSFLKSNKWNWETETSSNSTSMLKWYPNLWSLTFSRHLEKSRLETFSQRVCVVFPIQRMCRHSHLYLSMNAFWLASQSAAGTWTHRPPPGVSWGAARGWMAARDNKRFEDSQVVEWLMVVGFKSRRVDSWNVLMIWFMCFVYPICLYWKHFPPFPQYQLSHLLVNISSDTAWFPTRTWQFYHLVKWPLQCAGSL